MPKMRSESTSNAQARQKLEGLYGSAKRNQGSDAMINDKREKAYQQMRETGDYGPDLRSDQARKADPEEALKKTGNRY